MAVPPLQRVAKKVVALLNKGKYGEAAEMIIEEGRGHPQRRGLAVVSVLMILVVQEGVRYPANHVFSDLRAELNKEIES